MTRFYKLANNAPVQITSGKLANDGENSFDCIPSVAVSNLDESIETENLAVLALARKRQLLS